MAIFNKFFISFSFIYATLTFVNGTQWITSQSVIDAVEEFKEQEVKFDVPNIDLIKNYPEINKIMSAFSTLSQYYLPSIQSDISPQCRSDLKELRKNLLEPGFLNTTNRWGIKLVDSWGKEEDGLLAGNRRALGFFEECLHVERLQGNYFGRYCLMSIQNSAAEDSFPSNDSSPKGVPLPLPTVAAYSRYATCMPSSCTQLELEKSVTQAFTSSGHNKVATAQCQSLADQKVFDSSEIFGIVFFTCILTLLVTASVVDLLIDCMKLKRLRGTNIEFLLAFSVPHNMNMIFRYDSNQPKEIITCAHGIRFLSIAFIIFGHQYYYSAFATSNLYSTVHQKVFSGFLFQLISNSDKTVDTFFFLSGLFLALTFFKTMTSVDRFPVFGYYFHRIIRLMPPIAIYVCFLATLAGNLVVGPNAVHYEEYVVGGCREYWWVDLTFVNNILFRFSQQVFLDLSVKYTCIPQTWYVSADTQIFVFMPLVLLPIFYWKKKGLALFAFWTLLSFVVPAAIIGAYGLYPTSTLSVNIDKILEFQMLQYMMPYCRASPYFVGVWAGYLLWRTNMEKVQLSPLQVTAGWTLASLTAFTIIFVYYPFNHLAIPANEMGVAASAIYGGLQRGLWGACIAWLLLACHWGYGGMINSFLSHPVFQPLSRLSYSMYLISLPLQFILLNSTIRLPYYSHVNKIIETCGVLFLAGIGALMLTLVAEIPIQRIEKLFRKKKPKLPKE